MKMMWRSIVPALLVFMFTVEARAGVLATGVRETPTSVTTSAAVLPLTEGGATALTFSTASTQTVVITYSTDCLVGNSAGGLYITIYVDGVAAPGTGVGSAGSRLCALGTMAAHSRTVAITVGAGTHSVQVAGVIISSGTGTLRRTVLTVMN